MIEIELLTKDFFKKNKKEQELIERILCYDCMMVIRDNEISPELAEDNFNMIIQKAVDNDDYEVSEIFKRVQNKLKEINYGYKL